MSILDKERFGLMALFILSIAILFWTQSRFPALNDKLQMGDRTGTSVIAFEVVLPITENLSTAERVLYSWVNWAYTNWQGMTFGLLLGAGFLTLLSFVRFTYSGNNRFLQALIGTFTGAPLGVCANCSTPIAYGLFRGGSPFATSLAALSSSPTLNFIVLSMAIALLPFYMVVFQILAVSLYLLVVLPLVVRYFASDVRGSLNTSKDKEKESNAACEIGTDDIRRFSLLGLFLQKFWQVFRMMVPLMLLAGLLGVLIAEQVDLSVLSNLPISVLGLLAVGTVALILPVPIAFDVLMASVLLASGVPVAYVAVIWFALGVFSIYPTLTLFQFEGVKTTFVFALLAGLTCLALVLGLANNQWSNYRLKTASEELRLSFLNQDSKPQLLASGAVHLENGVKRCGSLSISGFETCFDRLVGEQLIPKYPQAICQNLSGANARRCRELYVFSEVMERALSSRDFRLCAELSGALAQQCHSEIALELGADRQSIEPCDQLSGSVARAYCRSEIVALSMEVYGDAEICNQLTDVDRSQCRATKALKDILATRDPVKCGELQGRQKEHQCKINILLEQALLGWEKLDCKRYIRSDVYGECLDIVTRQKAIVSGDKGLCGAIKNKALRSECELEATLANIALSAKSNLEAHLNFPAVTDKVKSENIIDAFQSLNSPVFKPINGESNIYAYDFFAESVSQAQLKENNDKVFLEVDGASLGVKRENNETALSLYEPFSYGRGIASGYVNDDLWPDLVMANADHVAVYLNQKGNFKLSQKIVTEGAALAPFVVSIVDINNDGLNDLYVSHYGADARIYLNNGGGFSPAGKAIVVGAEAGVNLATAFVDLDADGDLDFIQGNWSYGNARHFATNYSQNYVFENVLSHDGEQESPIGQTGFKVKPMSGVRGETLSVLASDIGANSFSEIVVGNDSTVPDKVFLVKEGAQLEIDRRFDSGFAVSSLNTMSLDSGDINNDGFLDIFSADMSFAQDEGIRYCDLLNSSQQSFCRSLQEIQRYIRADYVAGCDQLQEHENLGRECLAAIAVSLAQQSQTLGPCEAIPDDLKDYQLLCQQLAKRLAPEEIFDSDLYPQSIARNSLLVFDPNESHYLELADHMNVSASYWSWNAKFADLDLDGWLDLYVGNGFMYGDDHRHLHSNVFFHNQAGSSFERAEKHFGLDEELNSPTFTYLDLDLDGDLDIAINTVIGPLKFYINQTKGRRDQEKGANSSIAISLRDLIGNRNGIGAKVRVYYSDGSDNKKQQMREIKLSGGFMSYDLPTAYFGLPKKHSISEVLVEWTDGSTQRFDYTFPASKHYLLERKSR